MAYQTIFIWSSLYYYYLFASTWIALNHILYILIRFIQRIEWGIRTIHHWQQLHNIQHSVECLSKYVMTIYIIYNKFIDNMVFGKLGCEKF